MSEAGTRILATFETLSPREQHEVLAAMLRRTNEIPENILSDGELVALADDLFVALDAEESDGSQSPAR